MKRFTALRTGGSTPDHATLPVRSAALRPAPDGPRTAGHRTTRFPRPLAAGIAALLALAIVAPRSANATPYVVTLQEQGSDVVAVGSGAFDLTGLVHSVFSTPPYFSPILLPSVGTMQIGAPRYDGWTFKGIKGPASFGSVGMAPTPIGSGDTVWVRAEYGFTNEFYAIGVPHAYISGRPLSSSATWENASFASLGVNPGAYIWTWGDGAEQSFTLQIGPLGPGGNPPAVPVSEPTTAGMFGMGAVLVCGCVALRRRKARAGKR